MADTSNTTIIRCENCGTRNRVGATAQGTPRCANCHQALPWSVSADDATFEAEVTASVPVLVDFWAPWCGPCRMVSPVLDRIAAKRAGEIKLVKVNVDENPGVARRFGAMSIPLLVMIEDGKEVDRQVGAAPEQRLTAWIEPRLRQSSDAGSQS